VKEGVAMNPRERVLRAVHGQRTDRVPRDFWAEKPTLNRLLRACGMLTEEELLIALDVDIRHLNAGEPREFETSPGLFRNFWGEQYTYQMTSWGPMREDVPGALAQAAKVEDIESFPFPNPDCLDHSRIQEKSRQWESYALLYGNADIWQRPGLLRGWEPWFLDMIERPEWVHFLCRKFTDFYLEDYTRAAEAGRGRLDLYLVISDLGGQRGPLISPAMFEEFVAPYLSEMIARIHSLGGLVFFHSCGFIYPFIPRLIELGVDVLDPIQRVASEMEPEKLAAEFGGRICFHGGIDSQTTLSQGSPEQVREEVSRYCRAFSEGGYILSPSHLFQVDTPPENIAAFYSTDVDLVSGRT
jgi:uroporphyrinogen decarboxylase